MRTEVVSHGAWMRGPDAALPGGGLYQTFARADGADWYDHAHEHLTGTATRKALVRDGVVVMLERDGTRLVPPGEVLDVPDAVAVERGWLWRDGAFVLPPPLEPDDAVAKLRAFLEANPDVRAILR